MHCDVLVIGGGAAGCAAASAAAAGGARVILAERTPVLAAEVAPAEELQVLTRTAAVGAYDDGYVVLAQRDRLWHVRARRVILASGAVERTIAFAGNDRPGVMLASRRGRLRGALRGRAGLDRRPLRRRRLGPRGRGGPRAAPASGSPRWRTRATARWCAARRAATR